MNTVASHVKASGSPILGHNSIICYTPHPAKKYKARSTWMLGVHEHQRCKQSDQLIFPYKKVVDERKRVRTLQDAMSTKPELCVTPVARRVVVHIQRAADVSRMPVTACTEGVAPARKIVVAYSGCIARSLDCAYCKAQSPAMLPGV